MNRLKTGLLALILGFQTISFAQKGGKKAAPAKERIVEISTEFGKMKVKLYNETPQHRDNFIKLVEQKFYDSLLFHRVIKDFMIQGGDPQSKNAAPEAMLGNGDAGYVLPAEFNPKFIHKKGALAAARQGDEVNPTKASSGCQFYIVQGRGLSDADLTAMESRAAGMAKQKIFQEIISKPENAALRERFIQNQRTMIPDSMTKLAGIVEPMVEAEYAKKPALKYSPEQREAYKKTGGTPHLDMNYTVFGEVIEGLEVVDKIAAQEMGPNDRPKKDIKMTMKVIQ